MTNYIDILPALKGGAFSLILRNTVPGGVRLLYRTPRTGPVNGCTDLYD